MKKEIRKVRLIMEENNPKWEKGNLYPYFKFYIFYPVRYFIYSPVVPHAINNSANINKKTKIKYSI
jgi:hypothetical protein